MCEQEVKAQGRRARRPSLTYEGLVGGLREAALLVQQREHPHGLLQEEVQQRPVVLVLNQPSVHLLVQVLVLAREGQHNSCISTHNN